MYSYKELIKLFVKKLLENFSSTKVWVLFLASYFLVVGKISSIDWLIVAGTFLPIRIFEYMTNKNRG